MHCFPKAYQSILQNPMAKKYKHFKEQTRIPLKLNIEKNWCRQKKTTIEQFCKFQSIHIISQWKQPFSNKKPQNESIRGEITFWI